MGTRHRQIVIDRNGVRRISQYGQWDGSADGQGVRVLRFLRAANLNKYQEEVEKINTLTEKDAEIVNSSSNWANEYPYLHRDCGADIHEMISNGLVKFVQHMDDEEAAKWLHCEYVIDFQKGIFSGQDYGRFAEWKLDELPTEVEFLAALKYKEMV